MLRSFVMARRSSRARARTKRCATTSCCAASATCSSSNVPADDAGLADDADLSIGERVEEAGAGALVVAGVVLRDECAVGSEHVERRREAAADLARLLDQRAALVRLPI